MDDLGKVPGALDEDTTIDHSEIVKSYNGGFNGIGDATMDRTGRLSLPATLSWNGNKYPRKKGYELTPFLVETKNGRGYSYVLVLFPHFLLNNQEQDCPEGMVRIRGGGSKGFNLNFDGTGRILIPRAIRNSTGLHRGEVLFVSGNHGTYVSVYPGSKMPDRGILKIPQHQLQTILTEELVQKLFLEPRLDIGATAEGVERLIRRAVHLALTSVDNGMVSVQGILPGEENIKVELTCRLSRDAKK